MGSVFVAPSDNPHGSHLAQQHSHPRTKQRRLDASQVSRCFSHRLHWREEIRGHAAQQALSGARVARVASTLPPGCRVATDSNIRPRCPATRGIRRVILRPHARREAVVVEELWRLFGGIGERQEVLLAGWVGCHCGREISVHRRVRVVRCRATASVELMQRELWSRVDRYTTDLE